MDRRVFIGTVAGGLLACSRARGVLDADLLRKNATFATPATLVALVGWADKILSE